MAVFDLKEGNTRAILKVTLYDPDGLPLDLTGATVKLYIRLSSGTKLVRSMAVDATPTSGIARYTWQLTDWGAASGTQDGAGAYPTGGLVVGPGTVKPGGLVLARGDVEHTMEYKVTVGVDSVVTIPNSNYDTLRIIEAIGEA